MVQFNGGDYSHFIDVWVNWQDVGRNVSSIHFKYWIRRNTSAANGAYNGGTKRFTIWNSINGDHNEYRSYNFKNYQDLTVVEFDREFGHDANGYLYFEYAAHFEGHSQFFPSVHSGNHGFNAPRIPKAPGAPTGLTQANQSITNVGVNYTRGNNNGSGLTADEAHWYEGGPAGQGTMVWADQGPQGYTSPNGGATPGSFVPKPGTKYWVYIRSKNAIGVSGWSWIQVETLPGAPGLPRQVDPTFLPGAMVRLDWLAPLVVGANPIIRYDIQYSKTNNFAVVGTVQSAAGDLTETFGPLDPSTTYYFRIRAVNSYGPGDWLVVDDFGTTTSGLKRWNGSAYETAILKRWSGSSWQPCVLKRWNGSAWVPTK